MASLTQLLPQPTYKTWDDVERAEKQQAQALSVIATVTAPPYGQRKGWVPRNLEDFGDGGAFPEIIVAQYPLNMGRPNTKSTSNALAVQLDHEGKVKYDVIARQGHHKDKIVYSKLTDLLPSEIANEDDPTLQRPDIDDVTDTIEKTRQALEKLTNSKISAAMPVRAAPKQEPAKFIRYTPSQEGVAFNSGAKQRVFKMVELQKDPLEPPRFKINKKIPRGPPSPPAPVMHSPTRKVSVKEQKEWKIPPCVSNWKNAKGYTIPLDKRLAADGRGLQSNHINEKFAKLAEALYIADRKARESVELRAQVEKKMAQKEKEKKEEHLRSLAQKAREERAGIKSGAAPSGGGGDRNDEAKERDMLRMERHKERARDRNLARAAPDKRNKLQKERERDISEQIALGLPAKTMLAGEAQFDQRLFDGTKGMDSGFGEEDGYNVYDKPWRNSDTMASHVYRPRDVEKSGTRSGPVQYERAEEDPFGLDQFLTQAKKATKRGREDSTSDGKRQKRK